MSKRQSNSIMFQGTGSDVGKTVLVAGLCRAARNRGLKVAPFKPQNMSNNAAVAEIPAIDGGGEGEIGRAQYLQALACGIKPNVHMNPVLLKPQSETGSQIIVHGKVWGHAKGRDYQKFKPKLLDAVMHSFEYMDAKADLVLVEGAGSPAEINLRAGDIANMGFATKAGVPVVLVGDIDRGGVIASLVGTKAILPDGDCAMIAGFLINKFRGELSLFDDGLKAIEQLTGWRSFGVVPWLDEVGKLPAEDSVALGRLIQIQAGNNDVAKKIRIAVPVLDHIANFDDFDPLMVEAGVEVIMVKAGEKLPDDAALIILPGSKSTIADLVAFRENGWHKDLANHISKGGKVIGICGGYQMLGSVVRDPQGIEGNVCEVEGLGHLNVETELAPQKTVQNSSGTYLAENIAVQGYEIHLGETRGPDCQKPMLKINGRFDGAVSQNGQIMGCYLHGLFSSDEFRRDLLNSINADTSELAHSAIIDKALDNLADALEHHLDVDGLFKVAAGKI